MQAPETPKPNQPTEPICNNPVWYELYATEQEKEVYQAYLMQKHQDRNERRFRELLKDIEQAKD
jgi:hypothetical protein